jgi:hypothetical protein
MPNTHFVLSAPMAALEPSPIDSPALQAGVDVIVSLIEKNREDAARSSQEQFEKLQQLFYSYKHFSEAAHASERAKLEVARQEKEELRTHYEQCQQALQVSHTQIQDLNTSLAALLSERDSMRTQLSSAYSSALGSTPPSGGFYRSPYAEQPVPFFLDEHWVSFLEGLGLKDISVLSLTKLKDSLRSITTQLQSDRENARICAAELVHLRAHVLTLESTFDFPPSHMYDVTRSQFQDDVGMSHFSSYSVQTHIYGYSAHSRMSRPTFHAGKCN